MVDERQIGGYELHATGLKVYQNAKDYPITNKEHGVEFLVDNRHLWLRSRRQWAIMKVRNSVIYAIHNFFQSQDFVQMDAPIFTGNAAEGTTDLLKRTTTVSLPTSPRAGNSTVKLWQWPWARYIRLALPLELRSLRREDIYRSFG